MLHEVSDNCLHEIHPKLKAKVGGGEITTVQGKFGAAVTELLKTVFFPCLQSSCKQEGEEPTGNPSTNRTCLSLPTKRRDTQND